MIKYEYRLPDHVLYTYRFDIDCVNAYGTPYQMVIWTDLADISLCSVVCNIQTQLSNDEISSVLFFDKKERKCVGVIKEHIVGYKITKLHTTLTDAADKEKEGV